MLVNENRSAHHLPVVLEMGVPIRITQYEVGGAVGPLLILRVKEASQKRLNPEFIEVIPAGCPTVGLGWIVAGVEARKFHADRGQVVEGVVAFPKIAIVGIGLPAGTVPVFKSPEALGLGHTQRTENKRIHHAVDDGVGANGEGQRNDGCKGEALGLAQYPQRKPHVAPERIQKVAAQGFEAFLLESFARAKLDPRLPLGLGASHARSFQIVGPMLDMRTQFLIQVVGNGGTTEELVCQRAKIPRKIHTSSGRAARTDVMATASRFQPSVSSCKRLRPS